LWVSLAICRLWPPKKAAAAKIGRPPRAGSLQFFNEFLLLLAGIPLYNPGLKRQKQEARLPLMEIRLREIVDGGRTPAVAGH
jgi:hypothetical protein